MPERPDSPPLDHELIHTRCLAVVTLLQTFGMHVSYSESSYLIHLELPEDSEEDGSAAASAVADILNESGWQSNLKYGRHRVTILLPYPCTPGEATCEIRPWIRKPSPEAINDCLTEPSTLIPIVNLCPPHHLLTRGPTTPRWSSRS